MTRLVPYPILTVSLIVMWMMLTRFSTGHLILGTAVALLAGLAMSALQPSRSRLRRWDKIPRLVVIVLGDIIRSNIAVAQLILSDGRHGQRHSGFVEIPIDLRDQTALAILSIVITSTPGTAWIQFDATSGRLLIHVFDLVDTETWVDLVKNRYEALLMEIFE